MERERNSQKAKFWAAQNVLEPLARTFKTDKSLATFTRKARTRAYLVKRHRRELSYSYRVTALGSEARGTAYEINIPTTMRTDLMVARCLARLIFNRTRVADIAAFHGWEYCGIFLDVVHALMGKNAGALLKASYQAKGVRFKPKKVVKVTPEMLERLALARAKRVS